MFDFNATFFFALVSFWLFAWLMKLVFFDPIAQIKEARRQRVLQLQQEADGYLAQSMAFQQTLDVSRQDLQKDSQKRLSAALTETRKEQEALLDSHRAALQTHRQASLEALLQSKEQAKASLQGQKESFVQTLVSRLLHPVSVPQES
jgi:F0F1-type ATP synthase membrane subunit b/b'